MTNRSIEAIECRLSAFTGLKDRLNSLDLEPVSPQNIEDISEVMQLRAAIRKELKEDVKALAWELRGRPAARTQQEDALLAAIIEVL